MKKIGLSVLVVFLSSVFIASCGDKTSAVKDNTQETRKRIDKSFSELEKSADKVRKESNSY
jgi:hypothetical protein